ncbi:type III secretion system chaperone [Pantoea sp. 18069]|uniref:type III secretion system chaperone n=1 Tax=Pantoea sp. 18069 TaxID=2681415 RepID=UPI0013599D94|nr:type III secretion system chaperone [Pantoea sp. 18069]
MNTPERLQALLRELGQRMGLSQLPLDADGGCALELDQRMVVSLQYRETENELWLYADLGPVPRRSPAFYEKLLQANLFWRHTSGATLSLSADEPPHAVLARPLHWMPMDDTSLVAAVESFVNTVEGWQDQLNQAEAETEANAGGATNVPLADAMGLLLRSRA